MSNRLILEKKTRAFIESFKYYATQPANVSRPKEAKVVFERVHTEEFELCRRGKN